MNLSEDGMDAFIESRKIKIDEIKTSEDVVLSQGGQDIYEKFLSTSQSNNGVYLLLN